MRNKINWFRILSFFLIPLSVFIFHAFLLFFGAYNIFSWLDIPMHFFGGISIAIAFFLTLNYFQEIDYIKNKYRILKILFIVSFVALAAVLWEFFEFSAEYITGFNLQGDLKDTMSDLFLGLLGGFFSGIYLIFSEKS